MPKLQEQNNQFFITVPKELVLAKKWKKGIRIVAKFNEKGNIELEELKE